MTYPLMPKATAVWLVDNTTLAFDQIAEFCGLHPLEIAGIADGDVAAGVKGNDPVHSGELTREEISRCEANEKAKLQYQRKEIAAEPKRKGPRYTPLSKRQDRPATIAWLVRYHPELTDAQIAKLVGSTKPTIASVREKSHWNSPNIRPIDPVALGMCTQVELDNAVQKAATRVSKEKGEDAQIMSDEQRKELLSTDESLQRQQQSSTEYGEYASSSKHSGNNSGQKNSSDTVKKNADSFFNLKSSD